MFISKADRFIQGLFIRERLSRVMRSALRSHTVHVLVTATIAHKYVENGLDNRHLSPVLRTNRYSHDVIRRIDQQ